MLENQFDGQESKSIVWLIYCSMAVIDNVAVKKRRQPIRSLGSGGLAALGHSHRTSGCCMFGFFLTQAVPLNDDSSLGLSYLPFIIQSSFTIQLWLVHNAAVVANQMNEGVLPSMIICVAVPI